MKKFITALICALLATVSALGFSACKPDGGGLTVCAPDGAPALALAQLMNENPDFGRNVEYRIVGSSEISSLVTYTDESKNADLCILPVNAASKFLGTGARYKMLGAVTHGNLFLAASSQKENLTEENFALNMRGAKVGVVNLPAFPGAVFKLLLGKYQLAAAEVTLENVSPAAVSGVHSEYDYFVLHEPEASTRADNANLNLKIVGNIQTLYGAGGYPQAVLVAKTGLIQSSPEFVSAFVAKMVEAASWLLNDETSANAIISAITAHYADPENTAPSFSEQNLTKAVIENCAVRFEKCSVSRQKVIDILAELKAAGDGAATAVSADFFYDIP